MGYIGTKPSAVPLTSADITDGIIVNADIASGAAIALTKLASTGTLTVDNIQFPATQVASANANNLDDYEEGTWTPTLPTNGFNNARTLTSATGSYTKIGRQVTLTCTLNISGAGRPTSFLGVQGLPFTAGNTFAGSYGGFNAGSGIQGGSVMVYTSAQIIWYATNGTTDSESWACTISYFI